MDQAQRNEAIEEAIHQRHAFFQGLGQVYEEVFASMIHPGLAGGMAWPANQPKYRAIHTPHSTIVITDGLSDPFRDPARDPDLEYNGYSLELFIELEGQVEFGDLIGHFGLNMLGQVSQAVLGHGQFADMLDQCNHVAMSLWGGKALPEVYRAENMTYGVLIGGPSPNVPRHFGLNLEEIALISLRLIDAEQLIASTNRVTGADFRRQLMEEFQAEGSHVYTPLTL